MTSRSYCFTSFEEKEPTFNEEVHRYLIYQREKCPTTGREHFQGYVELFKKQRMKQTWKQMYPNSPKPNGKLFKRNGTRIEARNYCMKEESRINPPVEHGEWIKGQGHRTDLDGLVNKIEEGKTDYELIKEDAEQFERYHRFVKVARKAIDEEKQRKIRKEWHNEKVLNTVQKEILELLDQQNDRQVLWVTDINGGKGKTFLSKYMISKFKAQRFTNGRTRDIAFAYQLDNEYVIFDFSRSNEERINYQIIEDIKNGILFSSKYESKSLMFNPPKIVIMANFHPDSSKLSHDRWVVKTL